MGISIHRIVPGDGKTYPKHGDVVTIEYVGTLENGTMFASSQGAGKATFTTQIGVGSVIRAWDEAIPQLSLGERAILIASPDYAYGTRGFPPVIPPQASLKFEIQLVKIN